MSFEYLIDSAKGPPWTGVLPPFSPDFPRMSAAAQPHTMEFLQDFDRSGPQ
jgi:hypothetical protein